MSPSASSSLERSQLDEARFGVRVVKTETSAADVERLLRQCREAAIDLLIVRTDVSDLPAVHALEEGGGRLMDTLVIYERDLSGIPAPALPAGVEMAVAGPADADEVTALSRHAFSSYVSHYHADSRLPDADCTEIYASWAGRSCAEPGVADEVLVARRDGVIVGFAAYTVDGETSVATIDGVATSARRTGIHRALNLEKMRRAAERGARTMLAPINIANLASQRAFHGLGFVPGQAQHTFHLWFDAAPATPGRPHA